MLAGMNVAAGPKLAAAVTNAGGLGVIVVTVLAILVSALFGSGAAPSKEQVKAKAEQAKKAAVDAKDKAKEAVTTGAEKAQAEVNKRSTRSGGS